MGHLREWLKHKLDLGAVVVEVWELDLGVLVIEVQKSVLSISHYWLVMKLL